VWVAVVEHQIVDQWDLARHDTSVVCTLDRSESDSAADAEYQDRMQQERDFLGVSRRPPGFPPPILWVSSLAAATTLADKKSSATDPQLKP
jgi:hypothetical protein